MLIGTPAAFLLVRGRCAASRAMLAFVLSPIIVPRMIIAVGLFYFFARVGLVGTPFGLMLGHTVVAVPYVVMTMMAVLRNYDTRLDLAAQSLGARPLADAAPRHLPDPRRRHAVVVPVRLRDLVRRADDRAVRLRRPERDAAQAVLGRGDAAGLAGDRRGLDLPVRLPRAC